MSFRTKLISLKSSVPSRVRRCKEIYSDIGPWLRKYHGGAPVGFLTAIVQFESNGNMNARGDASLGEAGYFQISKSFPPKVGMTMNSRLDPQTNVFLGCLEYNLAAAELRKTSGVAMGTADSWKLARLSFAIGEFGTKKLLRLSDKPTYNSVKKLMDRTGGISLGRQSKEKVWFRVHAIDVLWNIGQRVYPSVPRAPVSIPPPPGFNYSIPNQLARYMPSPYRGPVIAAAALALPLIIGI